MSETNPKNRFNRHDYTNEIISNGRQASTNHNSISEPTVSSQKPIKKHKYLGLILILVILLLFVGGLSSWLFIFKNNSVVPKSISQSVSFPVYYPDPKKLPEGYTLNINSFSVPVKNGVTYTVNYDSDKKIVFSVQLKPSDTDLQNFEGSYLPLRTNYQTSVGQAEIGAYNSKTLVSLPTNSRTWLVITAPPDINQNQLKQVLSSIKKN